MKTGRILTLGLLVAIWFSCFMIPTYAASSLTLSFDCDLPPDEVHQVGDRVTYTVKIVKNSGGFVAGTFYFRPSANLEYESSTVEAYLAQTGVNKGAWGILIHHETPYTQSGVTYCSITFKVKTAGVATVDFYAYELVNGDPATETTEPVSLTIVGNALPKNLTLTAASTYQINDEDYLLGVTAQTTRSALLTHFEQKESIKVFAADGKEITDGSAFIGTGCTVSLMSGGTAIDSATVVVKGDTDGNGRIGTLDYQRIRAYYLGNYTLKGAYLVAARVTGRDTIGTLDYQRVRAHYLGNYNLYA